MAKLNEFNLVKSHLDNIRELDDVDSFYFFALGLILGISEPEIDESITDTKFLRGSGKPSGHDRGIDAVYISELENSYEVHLFNFKYITKFEKLDNNFESGEIDKIVGFISRVCSKDKTILRDVNPVLSSKVEQIWEIFERMNPKIVIHLCSNGYSKMTQEEDTRFTNCLREYDVIHTYNLMPDYVRLVSVNDHEPISAKVKVVGKNYFEKSDGNVRALVAEFEARDLVRIVSDDINYRNDPNIYDYSVLSKLAINDSCFKDNVRVYLKQRSKINKNIKTTLLSEDNNKIFYFNNGITIMCEKYSHPGVNRNAPIIELQDLQIVNGCQTVNALFEAFCESPQSFEDVTILCRIYETDDFNLNSKISEFTNSQNPVKSRDIRSIDNLQIILEKQLLTKEIYYERKKNQHVDKPKDSRIDAEVLGQALCAFYNDMPVEAKNKKASIFGDNYESIFNEALDVDKVLLVWKLFQFIEGKKKEARRIISELDEVKEIDTFILYASMYILFTVKNLAVSSEAPLTLNNLDTLKSFYEDACGLIRRLITEDEQKLEGKGITSKNFFKSGRLKIKILEDLGVED